MLQCLIYLRDLRELYCHVKPTTYVPCCSHSCHTTLPTPQLTTQKTSWHPKKLSIWSQPVWMADPTKTARNYGPHPSGCRLRQSYPNKQWCDTLYFFWCENMQTQLRLERNRGSHPSRCRCRQSCPTRVRDVDSHLQRNRAYHITTCLDDRH